MCGIAGCWTLGGGPPEVALAEAMAATLAHRGPDGAGAWADPDSGLALAHRRLAILDRSPAGAQPMASADGRWVICFNGEVYNHPALRRALAAEGVTPRGASDTAALLEACARWGLRGALARAEGMFAFALWDRRKHRLSLVRDPAGIKPLYWTLAGRRLLFASELKALRQAPGFVARPDPAALAGFFRHGYVPGPHTAYAGVAALPPGCILEVTAEAAPRLDRYADLPALLAPPEPDPPLSDAEAVAALEALVGQAVARQMVADVPVGVFLSGGVDSSLVAAFAQRASGRRVASFAIGFAASGYDESPHAAAVARHLGTEHATLTVTPAMVRDLLPRLPEIYDEPFADPSQLPTLLLCQWARRQVGVALSGDGGDELFGGYDRYQRALRLARWPLALPPPLRRAVATALRRVPAARLPGRLGPRLGKLATLLDRGGEDALYRAMMSLWPVEESPLPGVAPHPGRFDAPAPVPEFLRRMQRLDAGTYLPDDILVKVDRASMAVGLEVRVPLLERPLWALAGRLTPVQRLRGRQGKWALRQVLYRHVPRALVDRPKMGFGAPVGQWLRGPLRDWAEPLLAPASLEAAGLDPRPVLACWRQHLAGGTDWQYRLWPVLMFVAWQRRWA